MGINIGTVIVVAEQIRATLDTESYGVANEKAFQKIQGLANGINELAKQNGYILEKTSSLLEYARDLYSGKQPACGLTDMDQIMMFCRQDVEKIISGIEMYK